VSMSDRASGTRVPLGVPQYMEGLACGEFTLLR